MSENSQEGRGPYPAEGRERAVRMVFDPDDRSKSSRHTLAPQCEAGRRIVGTILGRRRSPRMGDKTHPGRPVPAVLIHCGHWFIARAVKVRCPTCRTPALVGSLPG